MTSISFLEFLLFLLLHQVYSEEAEPTFKAVDSTIEMGYCFGVDYILVYRSSPEGDQLLGNSSSDTSVTPPEGLRGRIHINIQEHLLGLQISNLTHMDSGIYRRECWQNHTRVNYHIQKLFVCDEEVEPAEIIVKQQDEGSGVLLCNSTSIGQEGTFVQWYYETYPSYKVRLFLDSSVSLDPLVKELHNVVEVRESGASLLVDNHLLQNNQNFYCLVIKGKNCVSFQNMYLPDNDESHYVYASPGDSVELNCSPEGNNQQWVTPLGAINGSSKKSNDMYISFGDKSDDFSLVIPEVLDEHSGEYSCMSSVSDIQYSLFLCPRKEPLEKVAFLGRDISLSCNVGKDDRVQWYRQEPTGDYELIHDSNDETVAIPDDLRGRLNVSESDAMLTISHLKVADLGMYRCVALGGPPKLDDDDDYNYGDTDYYIDEDEDDNWPVSLRCILKQEIILSTEKTTRRPGPVTTAETPAASNVTAYAVGGGLVGLLVIGVIVAVIVMKTRTKTSTKRREAASRSGPNTNIKMNVDPGCTESLTQGDEYGA